MERFHDGEKLAADIRNAVDRVLEQNGIGPFDALAMCAVLEAFASPLKYQMLRPLTRDVGVHGLKAYRASRLVMRFEQIKSPHSLIVSPLMEAVAVALKTRRHPMAETTLRRHAISILLDKSTLSASELRQELVRNNGLTPAFRSALRYLAEGRVIRKTEDGGRWELSD